VEEVIHLRRISLRRLAELVAAFDSFPGGEQSSAFQIQRARSLLPVGRRGCESTQRLERSAEIILVEANSSDFKR